MSRKQTTTVMVRFSEDELEQVNKILRGFPSMSATRILRALLLDSSNMRIVNALSKHGQGTWKGGPNEVPS